ncbi:MAG: phosphatidylglycerophosphatase A family protein [Planctomycetota bacterium]
MRRLIGTALGAGWLPRAPGTWGSAATLLVTAALIGVHGAGLSWDGLLAGSAAGVGIAAAVATGLGVLVGQYAEADFGRKDPGAFVLDEVAGQLVALLPLLPGVPSALGLLGAFLLFRLFDILKPWPCRALEALPGGVGIMADDLMAGAYAAGCLWAVHALT